VTQPSVVVLLLAIASGIVPCLVVAGGIAALLALPERSSLECTRTGDTLRCDELDWRKEHDAWRSRKVATHVARVSSLKFVHIGGHSAKDCLQFEGSLSCGGTARANLETLRALPAGKSAQLDITRSEAFGMIMGFGSLSAILGIGWLSLLGIVMGRRTRVRVAVHPRHLEIETRWGGLVSRAPRTLERVDGEMARVVMAERGARGRLPRWCIEYGGKESFEPLLTIAAIQKPIALEHAAARTRGALVAIPRTAWVAGS
jgi:hypothetical protein